MLRVMNDMGNRLWCGVSLIGCIVVMSGCTTPSGGVQRAPGAETPESAPITSGTHHGTEVTMMAMGYVDHPYRLGGKAFEEGFDCSGFVQSVYERATGKRLPRTSKEQALATRVISMSELQSGDLVFFDTLGSAFSHVGIYVGGHRFIHAPKAGKYIRLESMSSRYWTSRFSGARRVDP